MLQGRKSGSILRSAIGAAVCLMLATTAWATKPPAQIAVSPSRFDLQIGSKPTTESIKLVNLGREPVTITVSTSTWDLDEASQIRILEPDEQSLDQWLVINPLRFTIAPDRSQVVRFAIRPRIEPSPGEHRAMIYFDQQLPEKNNGQLQIKFRLGVAIYGQAGETTRIGQLNSISVSEGVNPITARFDISSMGSAHVRMSGQYAIYPADLFSEVDRRSLLATLEDDETPPPDFVLAAGALPSLPVLADTRRELLLRTRRELPPGRYMLDVLGELSGESIDMTLPFTIEDPALIAESDGE
jgi:P pilus assembly chaperone PapD